MDNAAVRFFKIMQNSGTDTISELVGLTVQSINPIVFTDGDKLILDKDFYIFHSSIDSSKIVVGDTFLAITLNAGQSYFVLDKLKTTHEVIKYNNELTVAKIRISSLENKVSLLESRVAALERRI